MKKIIDWFLKDVLAKALATYLTTILFAVLTIGFISGISNFLNQSIQIPVYVFLVLALSSLIGVFIAGSNLWRMVSANINKISGVNEELHSLTDQLLQMLVRVEAGADFGDRGENEFRVELLSLIDKWEVKISPYLRAEKREKVKGLREYVAEWSLANSSDLAKEWVVVVKELASYTRK